MLENVKIKKRGRTNCSLWIAVNCLNPNLCFVIFYQATLLTLLICLITCGGIISNISETIIWRTKCYAKIVIQKLAMACLYNYSFATCIFAWNYEWIITWEQPLNWVRRDDTRHEKWNIFMPVGNFSKFIIIYKSKVPLNEFKSWFHSSFVTLSFDIYLL